MRTTRTLVISAAAILSLNLLTQAVTLTPTGGPALNHVGNLVANGSFEDNPDPTGNTYYYWVPGSVFAPPACTPGSWTATGSTNAYASWASTYLLVSPGAAPQPDGNLGLYFGNGTVASISQTPTYNANGTVTFASAPAIVSNYGAPVTLSQTISGLTPSAQYALSFWVSGEDSIPVSPNPGFAIDGIFAIDLTGYSTTYLACPSGNSLLGTQHVYTFDFIPTTSSVTLTFTNWGHYFHNVTSGWISTTDDSTELVLDDVIINAVPEPATLSLLAVGVFAIFAPRRRN